MTHNHSSTASPSSPTARELIAGLFKEPLYWLLLAVPVAVVLELTHAGDLWIFIASCVAIVPLAGLMGRATENLAETMGAGIGGLLNATFGNAAELIIAQVALWAAAGGFAQAEERVRQGAAADSPEVVQARQSGTQKYLLVKASITGSIVGNILLVLGLSILAGGLRYPRQTFNRTAASMGSTLLGLASVGLLVPSLFWFVFLQGRPSDQQRQNLNHLSEEIALVLAGVYVLSLIFSLRTHSHLFAGHESELPTTGEHHLPEWNRKTSIVVLLIGTIGVAVMSEFLVGSVDNAAHAMGLNFLFVGVIVVAVIGNAAEHSTAILVALKNKMDLAVNIAVGSSLQIALFVAPVLVFASMIMYPAQPLDLHFSVLEVLTVVASIAILAMVSVDGESHWMEGVLLLAVYGVFALAFFHLPESVLQELLRQ